MLRCWSFNPEERPMFIYCLDVLMELKRETASGQVLGVPEVEEIVDKKGTLMIDVCLQVG